HRRGGEVLGLRGRERPQRSGGMTTQLLIDGRWQEASSDAVLPVLNPSTGKPLAEMSCASRADVDLAVAAARQALESGPWSSMTGFQRRSLLLAFAREVRSATDALGELTSDDMGMPLSFTRGAV